VKIPMSRPSVGAQELEAVRRVFESGWLGEGPLTAELERRVAALTGAPHAVAVNTGTSALHLALYVLGVGPGDEVIVPSLTFIADPMVVRLCGATPVFAEIEPGSLNLDPRALSARLTRRTRVVLPTDYAGLPADVRAMRRALRGKRVRFVRDASHSFGSLLDGRMVGVWAGEDLTCLSFDPIKNVTCGEGGMILARSASLARRLRALKRLGQQEGSWSRFARGRERNNRVAATGFRYHLSDINAAIGLTQLDRLEALLDVRRRQAKRYDERLAGVAGVTRLRRDYDQIVPFMYVIRVPAGERDGLVAFLGEQGVHSGLRYAPCHLQPAFRRRGQSLPVTEQLTREMLSLPLYADLSEDAVDRVAELVRSYLGRRRRESTS
jgi:perosamine synthetase